MVWLLSRLQMSIRRLNEHLSISNYLNVHQGSSHISIPNHDSNPVTLWSPQLEDFTVNTVNPWGWKMMIQPSSLAFLELLLLRCIGGVTFELPLRGTWVASGDPRLRVKGTRGSEALKDVMLRSNKNQHTTILWNIREYPKLLRLVNQNQSSTEHRLEKMAPTFS